MLPDWVSNPRPLTYESGALPIALRGPTKQPNENVSNVLQRVFRITCSSAGNGQWPGGQMGLSLVSGHQKSPD